MARLRFLLFLIPSILIGYSLSHTLQERFGDIHSNIDWLGGALTCSLAIVIDVGYRGLRGSSPGWERYVDGSGASVYVPMWLFGALGLVGCATVFIEAGCRW